jgi:hypothetical protein
MGLPVALAWSVYVAADYWRRDLRDPFSASRAAARWLSASGLTRIPIAAWPSAQAEALLPYLPGVRFYDPGIRDYGTHLRWDRATITGWDLPEDQVLKRTIEAFPRGDLVLLVDRPFRFAERAGFGLVHAEVGSVMMGDEQYFVYRRGPVSRAP